MENYKNILAQYNVEGYDPNAALKIVEDVDQNGTVVKETLFLRLQDSLAWFYTVFPEGCINHVFTVLNDRKATVTASVYRNPTDTRPAATATCTKYYDDKDINGRFFEQNAVTAAYRKALGYLGFGTPLDAHFVEGQERVRGTDVIEKSEEGAKLNIPGPVLKNKNIDNVATQTETAAVEERQKHATPNDTLPNAKSVNTELKEKRAAKTNADKEKMPTTFDEAKAFLMPFGACKGKSIAVTAKEKGNEYIRWVNGAIQKPEFTGTAFAKAVEIFCEFTGC